MVNKSRRDQYLLVKEAEDQTRIIKRSEEKYRLVVDNVGIGIVIVQKGTLESDVMIDCADKALYNAKNSGRNKVCFYDKSE